MSRLIVTDRPDLDNFRFADNPGPVSLSRSNQDGNGGTSTERRVISQVDYFRYRKLEEPPYLTRLREACTILPLVLPHGPSCQQNPCWLT
jgi:hypothetical protein